MVGAGRPVPQVQEAAERYRGQNGFSGPMQRDFSHVAVDPVIARHVAGLYEAAPEHMPEAMPSFRAMRDETMRQHEFMTSPKGLGLTHQVTPNDPYVTASGAPNSLAMMRDVHEHGVIKSMATSATGGHPFFTNDENDAFRAVHDVFGHAGTGRNFSADGEEAAYRAHREMYSPLARQAMTTETRGQNSTNNFGSVGGQPVQKVATLGPTSQLLTRSGLHRALGRQWQLPGYGAAG
jgi:hypothetical protein